MRLDLSQIIEIPGGSVPFSCVLDTGDLDFEQVKAYRSAPHAEGCVRNTAGILELTGTIEAAMKCVCDRCGGEYDTVKETALSALLSEDDSEEDDPDVFPLEGDSIDLTEILRTLFILDMRITTGMLNNVLADAQARMQPPTDKGRKLKIYYMTQTGVRPPNFVVFCNSRELFHFSYQRYLENQIRATFGLEGTPIRMTLGLTEKEAEEQIVAGFLK